MKTWIVLLLSAVSVSAQELLLLKHRPGMDTQVEQSMAGRKWHRFQYLNWSCVEGVSTQWCLGTGLFERVDRNRVYTVDAQPNDPMLSEQWALAKIQAREAWDIRTTNDVIVAVIDTGIDYNHEDLIGNLWTGPNGEHGYTTVGGVVRLGGMDDHLHGTHVAGTIGAVGNNAVGIAGLNWKTRLLSLKFMGNGGSGLTRDAVLCVEKMVQLKRAGHNIRVSNNSWGSPGQDEILKDAFALAESVGILNVCASGNSNADMDRQPFIPAAFTNVGIVSVLASDPLDGKAFFSNFGLLTTDVLAPGFQILSCQLGGGYQLLSGTSMASPHVAGVAAMMFALNPQLQPWSCKAALLDRNSLDQTEFTENTTGGGRLNAFKAWSNPKTYQPVSNSAPVITVNAEPLVQLHPGQFRTVSFSAADAEGDPIRSTIRTFSRQQDGWLIERTIGDAVSVSTNSYSATNRGLALDTASTVQFIASDSAVGIDTESITLFNWRDAAKIRNLSNLVHGVTFDAVENELRVSSSITNAFYSFTHSSTGQQPRFFCCYPITSPARAVPNPNRINTFRVQVMDAEGNFLNLPPLNVGGQSFPMNVQVSAKRGPAPLIVDVDATVTGPSIYLYFWQPWEPQLFSGGAGFNGKTALEFTEVGIHPIAFRVWDYHTNLWDEWVEIFTVLPGATKLNIRRAGDTVEIYWSDGALHTVEITKDFRSWSPVYTGPSPYVPSVLASRRFFRLAPGQP